MPGVESKGTTKRCFTVHRMVVRPDWIDEHARKVERICRRLDQRIRSGADFRRSVRLASWYNRGKVLKADPSKSLHLSRQNLLRFYYAWRKHGAAGVRLRYRAARKTPAAFVTDALQACSGGDVLTWERAVAIARRKWAGRKAWLPAKAHSVWRNLTPDDRALVRALYRGRHTQTALEAQLARALFRGRRTQAALEAEKVNE